MAPWTFLYRRNCGINELSYSKGFSTNWQCSAISFAIRTCFLSIFSSEAERSVEEKWSDSELSDDLHERSKKCAVKLFMSHKIRISDLRRTLVEFGRCFCAGSIAGVFLRDMHAIEYASNLRTSLRKFALVRMVMNRCKCTCLSWMCDGILSRRC